MRIELDNKFNIGNLVRKYAEHRVYKNDIVCPLCGGKHVVDNPVPGAYYDDGDDDDGRLYCPHCNQQGYLRDSFTVERKLDDEIYRIEGMFIHIGKNGEIEYTYSLQSTPELNNRDCMYCSCNAKEDELELVIDKE